MRKLFRAISVTTLAILLGSTAVTSAVAWLKIGYEVSLGNTGSVHLNAGAEAAYFGGGSVSSNAIPASFKIDTIDTAVKQKAISIARNTCNNIFEAQPSYSGADFKTVDIVLDNTGLTLTYSNVANDHNITVKNLSGTTLYIHAASA